MGWLFGFMGLCFYVECKPFASNETREITRNEKTSSIGEGMRFKKEELAKELTGHELAAFPSASV